MSSSEPGRIRILRGDDSRGAAAVPLTFHRAYGGGTTAVVAVADRAETARAEAYAQGYEAAMSDASASIEATRAAQLGRMSDALVSAASALAGARAEMVKVVEAEAVQLAFDLAEAIVRRELTLSSCVSVEAVTRAIGLVPSGEDVLVRVHPGDAPDPADLQALLPEASVRVVADPAVEAGGCVVEAGPCRIDAQIGPAIERARALLREMTEGHGAPGSGSSGGRQ
jgi:flagellar assembly protein FliH